MLKALVPPQQKVVGKTGRAKRKPVDTDYHMSPGRPRNPPVGTLSTSSFFVQFMSEWDTPVGVCASNRTGQKCEIPSARTTTPDSIRAPPLPPQVPRTKAGNSTDDNS